MKAIQTICISILFALFTLQPAVAGSSGYHRSGTFDWADKRSKPVRGLRHLRKDVRALEGLVESLTTELAATKGNLEATQASLVITQASLEITQAELADVQGNLGNANQTIVELEAEILRLTELSKGVGDVAFESLSLHSENASAVQELITRITPEGTVSDPLKTISEMLASLDNTVGVLEAVQVGPAHDYLVGIGAATDLAAHTSRFRTLRDEFAVLDNALSQCPAGNPLCVIIAKVFLKFKTQVVVDEVTATHETVRNKRQMVQSQFQNFDQKANQAYNLMSQVMKSINQLRMGVIRNML